MVTSSIQFANYIFTYAKKEVKNVLRKKDSHNNTIIKLDECKFIRQSGNTTVYLMKDNNAVKIFQDPAECKNEYNILKNLDNPYFPKVYNFCGHYFTREYINCINIIKYISIYGFNKELTLKLINLLKELTKLNLSKLDISLNDIFIMKNLEPIILNINESSSQNNIYEHISIDLERLGLLNNFLEVLKNYDEDLLNNWTK
jgi:RIO-like serine/threonine protein kinase